MRVPSMISPNIFARVNWKQVAIKYAKATELRLSPTYANGLRQWSSTRYVSSQYDGRLLVHGPDEKGIVASFTQLLYHNGCSIVNTVYDQVKEDPKNSNKSIFFQRIVFQCDDLSPFKKKEIEQQIQTKVKNQLHNLSYQLNWTGNQNKKRVAIMVSKYDHCLWELLLRHQAGELDCEICVVISNHPDLQHVAQDTFDIPYYIVPKTEDHDKSTQEKIEMDLLIDKYNVDVIVMARYMQILSPNFIQTFENRIINIHHSFLPAFIGKKPYHGAHDRGVKLVGATAHYATVDLDDGPIIEQDILRITHRDTVQDLIRKGRTLEKNVLVQALKAHLDDRVIVYKNKCIVFGE